MRVNISGNICVVTATYQYRMSVMPSLRSHPKNNLTAPIIQILTLT